MPFNFSDIQRLQSANIDHGRRFSQRLTTHDGRVVDSTGAFLVGELERLDLTYHGPLAAVTWPRDITLRTDVTLADEVSSFTLSTFGATTGTSSGISWIGKNTTQVSGISVDLSKKTFPLSVWGEELKYTLIELESAARLGRPIDQQKYEGIQLKHQMDIDRIVYVGDSIVGTTGLVNNGLVTTRQLLTPTAAQDTRWVNKTADEILSDVNTMLSTVWAASAYQLAPDRLLLPPDAFGYISTVKVSQAGNVSILKYILENNLLTTSSGRQLMIYPVKWLQGVTGKYTSLSTYTNSTLLDNLGSTDKYTFTVSGTDYTASYNRAVVYTNDPMRVRYAMTTLQRTPVQFESIYHKSMYYCRLGAVEPVYPQTIGYFDGL